MVLRHVLAFRAFSVNHEVLESVSTSQCFSLASCLPLAQVRWAAILFNSARCSYRTARRLSDCLASPQPLFSSPSSCACHCCGEIKTTESPGCTNKGQHITHFPFPRPQNSSAHASIHAPYLAQKASRSASSPSAPSPRRPRRQPHTPSPPHRRAQGCSGSRMPVTTARSAQALPPFTISFLMGSTHVKSTFDFPVPAQFDVYDFVEREAHEVERLVDGVRRVGLRRRIGHVGSLCYERAGFECSACSEVEVLCGSMSWRDIGSQRPSDGRETSSANEGRRNYSSQDEEALLYLDQVR